MVYVHIESQQVDDSDRKEINHRSAVQEGKSFAQENLLEGTDNQHVKRSRSDPQRIFDRIRKNEQGCWLYTRGLSDGGYGVVSVKNKSVSAHKLAYELTRGKVPEGLSVLHECDNRACINPDHLFLGTLGDNNTDRKRKGRNADRRGEKNTMAELTPEEIAKIRRRCEEGESQRAVALDFGICQQHVSQIVTRKAWPHIA